MRASNRKLACERAQSLLRHIEVDEQIVINESVEDDRSIPTNYKSIRRLLRYANLPLYPLLAVSVVVLFSATFTIILSPFVHELVSPLLVVVGAWIPYSFIESRANRRAESFAKDYPSVLLAAASSLKIGMTPYQALERSIQLLPKDSLVRIDIERLISDLHRSVHKEDAVNRFGADIRLGELSLFRSAFLLVLENGGKFAPTLGRLADVSRDRQRLITSSRVVTANMRMTANFLLFLAPVLLVVMSQRYESYWEILFTHPTAKFLSSVGISVIVFSFFILRRMSEFKP